MRRRDPISQVLFWVLLGATVWMTWDFAGYPIPLAKTWTIMAPWVFLAYVGGWEGELRVTPNELIIQKSYEIRRVPRHLLNGVRIHTNDSGLALLIAGSDEEQLGTGTSLRSSKVKARQLQYANELREAMIAIEMRPSPAMRVIVQPRRMLIYFGATLVAVAVISVCWQS